MAYERHDKDAYDTHPALAAAMIEWVSKNVLDTCVDNVLDPTAGKGPFVAAARAYWPHAKILAVDIREASELPELFQAGATMVKCGTDICSLPPAVIAKFDLMITNLPFAEADRIIRYLYMHAKPGAVLAFLLNLTFLGAAERWDDDMAKENGKGDLALYTVAPLECVAPIVPRPAFIVVDGREQGGKFEAGVFVWRKPSEGMGLLQREITIPGPLKWTKPPKPRAPRGSRGPRKPKFTPVIDLSNTGEAENE